MTKYVYGFEEGSKEQKFLLGGKGANLAEMTILGLPVPPGFTITTEACNAYMQLDNAFPDGLLDEVDAALEAAPGEDGQEARRRGRPAARVGAFGRAVLDAGDDGHRPQPRPQRRLGRRPREARRQRAVRVRLVPPLRADVRQDRARRSRRPLRRRAARPARGARSSRTTPSSTATTLAGLVATFKQIVQKEAGVEFPDDPKEQLRHAIEAVFKSWNGDAARDYRRMEKIPDDLGTAVNVQTMVFGNKGDDSGTGVAFTRNPSTGEQHAVRRLPHERAGRRRRRGHPHHRAARRDGQRVPRVSPAAARRDGAARDALPRHVRHRVHGRAGPPVHAADARRQAHRRSPRCAWPSRCTKRA